VDDLLSARWLARPLMFAALAALAFLPLEHLFPAHRERRRCWAGDLGFATVGQALARAGIAVAVGTALALLDRIAPDRPLFGGVGDRRARGLLDVACGLLLFEVAGYAYHRLAHRSRWLWRLHRVHHASPVLDWLASFRQHPLEIWLLTLAQNAPLVLLGIPLGAHATVVALLKVATVFVHANLRLPEGAWCLAVATPRFHHRHHQRDGAVRNYSSLFPFIDRLFGSYSADTATTFGLGDENAAGSMGPARGAQTPTTRAT
jgi:sterol desaturase/sphingolipid hydroxylase (fatty acid hydroxylase superfamily)